MELAAAWIILVAVLGSFIGSFLNVVIYRLPRGLSVSRPRWSFCPHCESRIGPLDNVPVVSWLLLRGRCRNCSRPIAGTYPLIECLTALLFVIVWDALFIAGTVPGAGAFGQDWPVAVALAVLFAGLLASSVMDIETYSIDIRISVFVMVAGVLLNTVRGLPDALFAADGAEPVGMLPPALSLAAASAGGAWLLTAAAATFRRRGRDGEDASPLDELPQDSASEEGVGCQSQTAPAVAGRSSFQPAPIVVLCCLIAALVVWQVAAPQNGVVSAVSPGGQRGFVACVLFFFVLVLASLVSRDSDTEIIEEIEAERDQARPNALRETVWLLPALAVGAGVMIALRGRGAADATWPAVVAGSLWGLEGMGTHAAAGLHAVGAMVLAAGLGWAVRILGTLGFGKEAFGTGDIYLMGAMGAAAGFWFVVFAFFLAALLALLGVLATLFRKSSRAIPFGPWLALGALATLWLQPFLLHSFEPAGTLLWSFISGQPLRLRGG